MRPMSDNANQRKATRCKKLKSAILKDVIKF